jgi:hypothetical protein
MRDRIEDMLIGAIGAAALMDVVIMVMLWGA